MPTCCSNMPARAPREDAESAIDLGEKSARKFLPPPVLTDPPLRLFLLLIVAWLVLMAVNFPLARAGGSIFVQIAIVILYVLIEFIILFATVRAKARQASPGEIWRQRLLLVLVPMPLLAWAFFPVAPARYPEVYFQSLTINGRAAQLILDTGSGFTNLGSSGADHLGVKAARAKPGEPPQVMKSGAGVWAWSDSLRLSWGNQSCTFPLPIGAESTEMAELNRRYGDDGAIGWPAVRDNILVFDPRGRTVRRVEALPAETAGWLKLKVHRHETLLLDLPGPNGKVGTVLVDTGDHSGVSLPHEQWMEWRAAHPQATVGTEHYTGDYVGSGTNEFAWADEFTLGGLTLTHVHVSESPAIVGETSMNYAGTLGLDVIERMDLVVDGPGGYAYLKPRQASDPAVLPTARNEAQRDMGNWSVDDNVRLRDGPDLAMFYDLRGSEKLQKGDAAGAMADFNLAIPLDPEDTHGAYSDRGYAKKDQGDFAGAIADYSRALELDPTHETDYENRALARIALGDYDGAIADYTRLIELDPENYMNRLHRGIARQIQADFDGALADYDRVVELNPNDSPHSRLNRQVLRLRLGTAPADFADNLLSWQDTWMESLGRFVAGELSSKALLAAAGIDDSGPAKARRAVADYYIGMIQLQKGDRPGARTSFQDAVAAGGKTTDEYQLARAELARLQDPIRP